MGKYMNIGKKVFGNGDASWERPINVKLGTGTIYRGNYELLTQSQAINRDLMGEEIQANLGYGALGYMLTDKQLQEERRIPYRYIIYSPESAAFNWTAFYARKDMGKWLNAYDLKLDIEPQPGDRFKVIFPKSTKKWQPIRRRLTDSEAE